MCGIVAGLAERNIVPILLEGLKRLEYRGYDSAGIAVLNNGAIQRCRALGKVSNLAEKAKSEQASGTIGIAHTRWATHGAPSELNAHPHMSNGLVAVVHNGIIENYLSVKTKLQEKGYVFTSETDSEVIAHLIYDYYIQNGHNFEDACYQAVSLLKGAFAIAVCIADQPDELFVHRSGSPMVIGLGIGENFVASDTYALLPITNRFIYLQENDSVKLTRDGYQIYDASRNPVTREIYESDQDANTIGKNGYTHFMEKEIFEQPSVIAETMEGRIFRGYVHKESFPTDLIKKLSTIKAVDIIACGTSYHAGLIVKFEFEKLGIRTNVEYASEYLYRDIAVSDQHLFLCISQSGETADTLAALKKAKSIGYSTTLSICNVPDSAIVREADFAILTRAGREIGVASTKAFVTQLVVLKLITLLIIGDKDDAYVQKSAQALMELPTLTEKMLALDGVVAKAAEKLKNKAHCLFLGRGEFFAIAAEAALKVKELSYIHAEAYPCGELKHGPLALIDEEMPVVAVVKNDHLAEKVMSNLQEVQARGGELIIFADEAVNTDAFAETATIINLGHLNNEIASIAAVVPLQLFAYHIAILKGTDVDQPRNLAKSVTVE